MAGSLPLSTDQIEAHNAERLAALEDDYASLGRQLERRGIDIAAVKAKAAGFSVAVPSRVLTNLAPLLLRLARAGRGLTMLYEREVRGDLARGDLVAVLEEYSTPFPGFYLFYPGRRDASLPLRALVDFIRRTRERDALSP